MTDPAAAWLRFQIASGEAALALRQGGATWQSIADELGLADASHARRAAALFLSADLASRETAQDRAGDAHALAGGKASPEGQRAAVALR
jgi:hypothetical protein